MADEAIAIKQRLVKFFKYKHVKFAEVERTAGLANGFIRNSKGDIGAVKLRNINMAYPDLNMNWLLTGIGTMTKAEGGSLNQNGDNAKGVKDGNMIVYEAKTKEENISEELKVRVTEHEDVRLLNEQLSEIEKERDLLRAEVDRLQNKVDSLSNDLDAANKKKDEYGDMLHQAQADLIAAYKDQIKK